MMLAEMGVLAAKAVPAVAPMKKIGVTMPPLPPKPSVTVVKNIFFECSNPADPPRYPVGKNNEHAV